MLPRRRPSKSQTNFVSPLLKAAGGDRVQSPTHSTPIDAMASVLADAGCTLVNPSGPPCLPSDLYVFRQKLDGVLSRDASVRSRFLKGFEEYVSTPINLRRVLLPSHRDGFGAVRNESLVKMLLLVRSIQEDIVYVLLQKLPEYFDSVSPLSNGTLASSSSRLEEDNARLILNQFRWLDFFVNPEAFAENLMQVLSISPHYLKKEIIGSLPEIIGDQNNKTVVSSLQQMLQEDSSIIVPVLDSFSNLNLDELLQDQVIMIALSCLKTIDYRDMTYLLRFLLLSANSSNARRILSQIREKVKFAGGSYITSQEMNMKGKAIMDNAELSILDSLRSNLRFNNMLCLELLKELKSMEEPRDHKVIDIWLLIIVFMNSDSLQRNVEKLFKKKILDGCIQEHMFDQCIHDMKGLPKDFLPTFVSLASFLLACKESRAQDFGIHMYLCLFEDCDAYSRQEVLGGLITHLGSGICYEVTAALDAMVQLAYTRPQDLVSFSSHITGILEYIEGLSVESLHKVFDVFIRLAVSSQSSSQLHGCCITNELLVILRKQINNSNLEYKQMGLIGTFKIVSYIADAKNSSIPPLSQRSNHEEALELLKMSLDACKQLPLPLILFYEELVSMFQTRTLHPTIMEWVGKQVGEFESIYLSDIDRPSLVIHNSLNDIDGDLWMNLDGDISPICLNALPLVHPSNISTSQLQVLPAKFSLLAMVEKLANQGSLGGIDALLGCPLNLPLPKLFGGMSWQLLTAKQKQIVTLSVFYAANWIRELLNAFSSQVIQECNTMSQSTKGDLVAKILKRLRNLVFLECLLDSCLKQHPVVLPELYPHLESAPVPDLNYIADHEKMSQRLRGSKSINKSKKRLRGQMSSSPSLNSEEKGRQPTIVEAWTKAGFSPIQQEDLSAITAKSRQKESQCAQFDNSSISKNVEVSAPSKSIEAQYYKFRPLTVDCIVILACLEDNQGSCCADPSAKLPLHLYLLRDLRKKLDRFRPTRKKVKSSDGPVASLCIKEDNLLNRMRPMFTHLRLIYDRALDTLMAGAECCKEHWQTQSNLASNPEIESLTVTALPTPTSICVIKETFMFFRRLLNLPDILEEKAILGDLLQVFQPTEISSCFFEGVQLIPTPGNLDYLYSGVYIFLGGAFDVAINISFMLASEVFLTLESVISSIRVLLNISQSENRNTSSTAFNKEIVPLLSSKLGNYAHKLLMLRTDDHGTEGSSKTKGDMIQKILRSYLENSQSTSNSLSDLARSIFTQVSSIGNSVEETVEAFPTLSSSTITVWCRVLHEENIDALNRLVKETAVLQKRKAGTSASDVGKLLNKILESINVVVSLTSICKENDKVALHAMTVKYGRMFIDGFLKVFDFLKAHFNTNKKLIIEMIRELQKATRVIQSICSEAKGLKQTAIIAKIPATKRSLERFLFHVKALLHTAPSGYSFWMGNLKHKNLMGDVVSSQAYLDADHNNDDDDNPDQSIAVEDQMISVSNL